ncbi:hypothetical protein TraAM80_01654 [Trypanosoma rangeli]|uniref:Uncharacterized protein n=1 Tax=Trypanosoma rangeli TaxID=5698 RepID=A0A3S5IS80_TRYRA|nr:uncharacterized protein TraAM80_01654 [Trypanosoma rangeli]RNF10215.1 hypothetical protein TraAM80_01654 [Trypanosoma rangeli]|eukprot:RNF10215.1 hypothetical protein TraAM80_01654 [Trypanosoma rangeli]
MIRTVYVTLVLCFILIAQPSVGVINAARRPEGAYCGDYIGMVKGRILASAASEKFDILLDIFHEKYSCKNEKYTFDERTKQITIIGATDPKDCLGKVLVDNGLSLAVSYAENENTLYLDLGIVGIKLAACS